MLRRARIKRAKGLKADIRGSRYKRAAFQRFLKCKMRAGDLKPVNILWITQL